MKLSIVMPTYNEKEIRYLIIILALAFALRLFFAFSSPVLWWDEAVYANLGYDLSHNPFDYSFNNSWSDFVPAGESPYSWPNAGFRAPLLPYLLGIFYLLKLDFLILLIMPVIGTLCVFFAYVFGKNLFNKKAGLISAFFLAILPLHVFFSGKILTDVFSSFFILLSFICFWKGFEQNNNKYKILFGLFLALALLSRYTVLWIMPVFLIYFLIKNKNFNFLKDRYLWYSILLFFIVLIPLFIYSQLTYRNPLGAFIHGFKALGVGNQSWFFFFSNWLEMFSLIGIIFIFSLIYIIYKKEYKTKQVYFLLISIIFFLFLAIFMKNKEERFILPIAACICLLAGFLIEKIKIKKIFFIIILAILLFSAYFVYFGFMENKENINTRCFNQAVDFLKQKNETYTTVSESSVLFYYYLKKESGYYPGELSFESLSNIHSGKKVYFIYTKFDSGFNQEKLDILHNILDKNYKKEFECKEDAKYNFIYSKG